MYLSASQAGDRLFSRFGEEQFGDTVELLDVHVEMAERNLRSAGPFVGVKYDSEQSDDFPRSVALSGDENGEVPEAVLDYVCLRAGFLAISDTLAPVTSKSLSGVLSKSYSRPKMSKLEGYLRTTISELDRYRMSVGHL